LKRQEQTMSGQSKILELGDALDSYIPIPVRETGQAFPYADRRYLLN